MGMGGLLDHLGADAPGAGYHFSGHAIYPGPYFLKVWVEALFSFDVRVANPVPFKGLFSTKETLSCHQFCSRIKFPHSFKVLRGSFQVFS